MQYTSQALPVPCLWPLEATAKSPGLRPHLCALSERHQSYLCELSETPELPLRALRETPELPLRALRETPELPLRALRETPELPLSAPQLEQTHTHTHADAGRRSTERAWLWPASLGLAGRGTAQGT